MLGPCHLVVSGLYAGTRRLSPWWWRSSIRTHAPGLPNAAHRRSHIAPVARTLEARLPCSDSDMGCSCGPLHPSWFVWSAVANGVPRLNTVHLSLLPAVHLTHQIEHSIRWRRKGWLGRGCGEEHGEVGLRCGVRLLEFERSIADVDHQVEGTSAKFLYYCTESKRKQKTHRSRDTCTSAFTQCYSFLLVCSPYSFPPPTHSPPPKATAQMLARQAQNMPASTS